MNQLQPPAPDADEINLCKDCGNMKHLNADGLCGRCAPDAAASDEFYGDFSTSSVELWPTIPRSEPPEKAVAAIIAAAVQAESRKLLENLLEISAKLQDNEIGVLEHRIQEQLDALLDSEQQKLEGK